MKIRVLIAALAAVVSLTAIGAAPAVAASSTSRLSAFYSVKLADSVTVPSGSKVHVGDVVITQGQVSEFYGGHVGGFTLTETVVDPNYKGGNQARIARGALVTNRGTLLGEAMVVAPYRHNPPAGWYMSVVGGTGAYRSATGTMTLMYVKGRGWMLSFDATLENTPLTQSLEVVNAQSADTDSTRPGGLGAATATVAAVKHGGEFLAAAVTVARGSKTNLRSVDASITTPGGMLLLRGLVNEPRSGSAPASYAVLGGTGDYLGVRGEARIVPESATRSKISLTYTRLRDGRPETPTVTATQTRSMEATIIGGTQVAQIGTLNGKTDDHKVLKGTFDQYALTSVMVGDVAVTSFSARYDLSGGSLIIGGVGRETQPTDAVILGGNSEFAGSRGSVAITAIRRDVTRLDLTMWRGGVGPAR